MKAALLHLDQVCEEAREHHATLAAERSQTVEELRVGEIGELHGGVVHPRFFRSLAAPWTHDLDEDDSGGGALEKDEDIATLAPGRHVAETPTLAKARASWIASRKIGGRNRVHRHSDARLA